MEMGPYMCIHYALFFYGASAIRNLTKSFQLKGRVEVKICFFFVFFFCCVLNTGLNEEIKMVNRCQKNSAHVN